MDHADRRVDQFLEDVASDTAPTAGGAATAVVGAIGASLCEMVCASTTAGPDGGGEDLAAVREDLARLRGHLGELADRDAAVVEELFASGWDGGDESAMKRATGVPLATAEACLEVLDHATVVTERGNRTAVPDAVTGAFLADAALRAALFTVRCNLERIADRSFVDEQERRAAEIERSAQRASDRVLHNAEDALQPGPDDR